MRKTSHGTATLQGRNVRFFLGPGGNAQGGHKFYTLSTGQVVTRRAWTELPTPQSVIDCVHLLAKGMRAFPIFTDRTGRVIGDAIDEMQYDNTVY